MLHLLQINNSAYETSLTRNYNNYITKRYLQLIDQSQRQCNTKTIWASMLRSVIRHKQNQRPQSKTIVLNN